MKVLKLIANAETNLGDGYRKLGKRFHSISEMIKEKPRAMIKQISEKIKKIRSKKTEEEDIEIEERSAYSNFGYAKEVATNLKEKFDEKIHGRISQ